MIEENETEKSSTEEYQREYPEGITEEVYKEGNATITKRIVVKNNRGTEYKRAAHTWGVTFYFKNDVSTTARVWEAETTEK